MTGRTKTEVKAKLRQLRHELDSGVRSSATYTVGNALDDWLAGGLHGRSDRTRGLYRDTVKPLRDRLADVKLRDLTAGDVQQSLDALAGQLSTRSLQIIRNCLERAIRHAEIRDLTGRNVAALVKAQAATAAVQATADEMSPSGSEHAGQLAMAISEVFGEPMPDVRMAGLVRCWKGCRQG